MKSYAVSIWLQTELGPRLDNHTGEFSEAEIAAWEAASRRGRRIAWIASIHGWFERVIVLAQGRRRQRG